MLGMNTKVDSRLIAKGLGFKAFSLGNWLALCFV